MSGQAAGQRSRLFVQIVFGRLNVGVAAETATVFLNQNFRFAIPRHIDRGQRAAQQAGFLLGETGLQFSVEQGGGVEFFSVARGFRKVLQLVGRITVRTAGGADRQRFLLLSAPDKQCD